jgi:hypothetical protein
MTLFDIQRLARRIPDVLHAGSDSPAAPKLAEDFAAACHATNLRLQQCETMLNAGDRHQAVQLAETPPNLLDCVTALEFREADLWRAYCEQHGLPVADRIDARSVRVLNECYAQGISTDHPLYAGYRKAVLSRDDQEALKALQSIVRLNPADANAVSELTRLDAKVLQARLLHLDDLLEGGDAESVVAEVVAIEGFGFEHQPAGESWRKAQTTRCAVLLGEAETASWAEALSKLDHIRRLQSDCSLELPADLLRRIEAREVWGRAEQDKDKLEREFRSLLAEMRYLIQQSEEKDTSARQVRLAEMKEDFERLHKVWRALEDFARPIPDDAAAAFRKRSALLEAEIARRTLARRRALTAGVIAALLLVGAAAWFTLAQYKAGDLARQAREAVAARKVRTAEKFLEYLNAPGSRIPSGALAPAVADAESFVARERNLLRTFEDVLAKLPKDLGGSPLAGEVARLGDQLSAAQTALASLAPDLRAEEEPKLRAFERRWEKFLSDSSGVVNEMLEKSVASGEHQCSELDYRSLAEQARRQLAALSNHVFQIAEYESGFTNHLRLRTDLLQRAAAVRAKFAAYDGELRKLDGGMLALQKARAAGAYSNALALMASSEFSSSPLAKAAVAAQAVAPSDEGALRFLLGATNGNIWAFLKRDRPARFVPETAFPAEQAIFRELNDDPAVGARLQRVRLWLSGDGAKTVDWLTVGSFTEGNGWQTIKACEIDSSRGSCSFSDRKYGFFDGQYRLSSTQPIYRVETLGSADEAAVFRSVGFPEDFGTGSYRKPLLEVLDAIKDSRDGSPLFRAYLFLRATDIMALQPESWGLAFAPAVSAHRNAIRGIAGELASGAWFAPMRVKELRDKLDQFFGSIKAVSYARQAAGLFGLAHEAARSGLQYVGFVSPDGKPNFIEGSPAAEVWGYSADRRQPVLVANKSGPGTAFIAAPMPLSPLFSLAAPRGELLAKAGIDPNDSLFAGVLPPLFASEPAAKTRP